MIRNPQAAWVVAFDDKDRPIATEPWNWSTRMKGSQIELAFRGFRCRYELQKDVACVQVVRELDLRATGRTLGRMAVTGVAASLLRRGSFLGGALLDLSLRGGDRRKVYILQITFRDHTIIICECDAESLSQLAEFLPKSVISGYAEKRMVELLDIADRMVEDGERVLPELDAEIDALSEKLEKTKALTESGADFKARDRARDERISLDIRLDEQKALRRAVRFGIELQKAASSGKLVRRPRSPILLLGGSFLLFLIAMMIFVQNNSHDRSVNSPPETGFVKKFEPSPKPDFYVPPLSKEPAVVEESFGIGGSRDDAVANVPEPDVPTNTELSSLQVELMRIYSLAVRVSADPDRIRGQQQQWQTDILEQCNDDQCRSEAIRTRIGELKKLAPGSLNIRG